MDRGSARSIRLISGACSISLARIENVLRHVQRKHQILLSSRCRSDQPPKKSKPYTFYIKRILVYQSSWYLFAVMLILTISMHWQNILINNMTCNVFHILSAENTDWLIGDVNITKKFDEFRKNRDRHEYINLDKFFCQLLAMSSILFIQRRSLYNNIPSEVLSPQQQQDIRISLMDEIGFQQFFEATDYEKVKAILNV
ncbi:hypothetical protein RMCBS344292_12417 [Rhizopus microsporus]|nr:hypothetical protein RMCBS344292_12417 [Rhizopus microsporus]